VSDGAFRTKMTGVTSGRGKGEGGYARSGGRGPGVSSSTLTSCCSYPTVSDDSETYWSLKPVWLSGNALVSINAVTLRQARLVPGWVTALGRVNHFGAEPGT